MGEQSLEQEWMTLKNGFKSHEHQWIHIGASISPKCEQLKLRYLNFKSSSFIVTIELSKKNYDDQSMICNFKPLSITLS